MNSYNSLLTGYFCLQITMHVGDYRDNKPHDQSDASFVEYQDNMVKQLRNIARDAQDMVGKANTKPKELGSIAQDICKNYNALSEDTKHAIRLSNQPEVSYALKTPSYASYSPSYTLSCFEY